MYPYQSWSLWLLMADPCARASSQYAAGDIKRALSNILRCQKNLEQQLRKYKNNPDVISQIHLQLARAYRFEGQIYFGEQNSGKAHHAFTSALSAIKKSGSSKDAVGLKGQIRYSLAIIALMRNQQSVAIGLLLSAKNDFFESDLGEQGVEVMLRLGTLHRDMGKVEKALKYFKEVQKSKKQASSKKNRRIYDGRAKLEEARILHNIKQGNVEKLLKKAKKEFSKADYSEGIAQTLLALANLYEGDVDRSRDYLLEAKELGELTESAEIQGAALTRLGVIALKSGQFDKGKDLLLEGLKYRTEAGDTVGTAQTLVELSRITLITSRNDDDLQNAIKFANQAITLYEEAGHTYGQATTLELLGSIHTKLGNIDQAKKEIQEGKSLFARYGDDQGEARMLTQMGLIYDQEDRSEEAIIVLNKAVQIFQDTNNQQGLAEALHVLAMQYRESDKSRAYELLGQSRDIYEQLIGSNKDMQIILQSLDKTMEELKS